MDVERDVVCAVDSGFVTMPSALPHASSGRLRVLAIVGPRRSPRLPDVPTVAETLPGFDFETWLGILAPAHTPQEFAAYIKTQIDRFAKVAKAAGMRPE